MCVIIRYFVLLCFVSRIRGVWSKIYNFDDHYNNHNYTRISGGSDASISNYPHNAFLEIYKGTEMSACGGAIVSNKCIVTSAKCLVGAQKIIARIASTYASDRDLGLFTGAYEYSTTSFVSHPRYNDRTRDYDIGVVKFSPPMNLEGERAKRILLPSTNSGVKNGEVITITGWGSTEEGGNGRHLALQMGKVTVIPTKVCQRKIRDGNSRVFCAEGEATICKVDYGAPALGTNNVLIGIASRSFNCSDPEMPSTYTRVDEAVIRTFLRVETGY